VALSLLILTSLGGFSNSVRSSMLKDARQLHAADIVVHSHYPLSPALTNAIQQYKDSDQIQGAQINEFYSMAWNTETKKSILSDLKVVERGYPFYGEVKLASGRNFQDTLREGVIIVEQVFLDRLQASIGDNIQIGSTSLTIVDIMLQEPDRPVSFFSFGPRVFVSAVDLEKLDLIKKGSRVHYNYLIKVNDPDRMDSLADELSTVAADGQERVRTYKNASSRVKRFFENLLFFLNLIGIFTLLLAGIGIQTSLRAVLRESDYTIAIMKSVGATSRYITSHFLAIITLLGSVGTLLGILLSYLLQFSFPILFAGILPAQITLTIDWITVTEGLLLGALVVLLFSYLPLQRIKRLKPAFIFRKELPPQQRDIGYFITITLILLFFMALVIWQLEDVKIGLYFILGVFSLIGISTLITHLFMHLMRKISPHILDFRQAFRGLFRPGNATRSIIITLSASLSVIFSIYLIDQNLQATFIESYPPHLPNAYFLDIQPEQKKTFADILDQKATYYPVIRARLTSINTKPIDREKERQRRRDNLAREFNLTYRDFLLEDERILEGKSLFGNRIDKLKQQGEVPMSLLDTVADIGNIKVGDLLVFNVQGIPLNARVTSMRTRTESKVRPFFYFVFQKEVLKDAPQTIFCATKIDRQQLTVVQNKLASQLPNISVIDIGSTIKVLAKIMGKMTTIVQFFTAFSIIAGLLIIISSILATKLTRTREAVYYKVLGAKSGFVVRVFTYENLIIALLCALMAAGISHIGSWIICREVFEIQYKSYPVATMVMIVATVLTVISVGLGTSIPILRQKPVPFLRNEEQQ
jgi:putative ABC transport system permease protein